MDELIVRSLQGDLSDIEARRVAQWRAASDENGRRFEEIRAVWELTGAALPEVERGGGSDDAAHRVAPVLKEAERRRRSRVGWGGWARKRVGPVLGGLLAAASVAALWWVDFSPNPGTGPALAPIESTTAIGDVTTMSLSDGSVIRLAAESAIEFPEAVDREVVLSGRAFFAVAEDGSPFRVRTELGEVTVLGTRFEVSTVGDELRLVVVEGEVLLRGEGGEIRVHPGEVAWLGDGAVPRSEPVDVWSFLDWPTGLLVFQDTPLASVAEELARHFEVDVDVDPSLDSVRVTAWFGGENLEEVASAVCLVAGASCEIEADRVTFGR